MDWHWNIFEDMLIETRVLYLQKLVGLGFSTKHTRTLNQGGYYHVYAAADVNTIEKNVNQRITEIQSSLNRIKRKFRTDIEKIASAKLVL